MNDLTIAALIVLGLVLGLFVLGICFKAKEHVDEQQKKNHYEE